MQTSAEEKKQAPLPPVGQHLALLYSIIDYGTQKGSFNGQPTAPVRKVKFCWEFPNLPKHKFGPDKPEQPLAIFQEYTFSLNEKANFRKMMDSWIGQPVTKISSETLQKLLGKPCMIQVEHKPSKKNPQIKYANIAFKGLSVYKRPAEMPFPKETSNAKFLFDLDAFSWEAFNKLNKWDQEKVRASEEWTTILSKFPEPKQQQSDVSIDDESIISSGADEEDPFN